MILIPILANRKGILYTLLKSEVAWKEAPKIERQHRDLEKYFEQAFRRFTRMVHGMLMARIRFSRWICGRIPSQRLNNNFNSVLGKFRISRLIDLDVHQQRLRILNPGEACPVVGTLYHR